MQKKRMLFAALKQSEHAEQVALAQWAELHARKYPDLALMFAIPNGGKRHIAAAKKMRAEGWRLVLSEDMSALVTVERIRPNRN